MENKQATITRIKTAQLLFHVQRGDGISVILAALNDLLDFLKTIPRGEPGLQGIPGPRGPLPKEGVHYNLPTVQDIAAEAAAKVRELLKGDTGFIENVRGRPGEPGTVPSIDGIVYMLKNDREFLNQVRGQDGDDAVLDEQLIEKKLQVLKGQLIREFEEKMKTIPTIRELPREINLFPRSGRGGRAMLISDGGQLMQDIQTLQFTGSGGSITRQGTTAVINMTGGGSSVNYSDELAADSGDHTTFTISHTPNSGSLLVINENTGQAIPASSYTNTTTSIIFNSSQQVDDGAGTLVTPTFRAKYTY